jgi:O-acetylserine/cysteine efflux transporter
MDNNSSNPALSLRHALLALAVMFVWGTNFTIIHIGLDSLPPLLFAALRFTLVLFPAIFFLPRPRSVRAGGSDHQNRPSWGNLAVYGLAVGFGQFGLLFLAMNGLISPGLASLVIQMQVFFTIGISMVRNGERLRPHQIVAFALALLGMGVIAAHNGPHDGRGVTLLGLVLVLGSAASWAVSNQAAREAGRANPQLNMLAYVVWASMFSLPPLYLLSLLREGGPAIVAGLSHATPATWGVVLWQSLGNTMFGYGCWGFLLARYPAATIAPLALLVPVFGFGASALWLGEPLESWKIIAALLVMSGLAVNLLWRRGKPKAAISGPLC